MRKPSEIQHELPPPVKAISKDRQLNRDESESSSSQSLTVPQQSSSDVTTNVNVTVKTPQIILLEDQNDVNSNCLVLDFAFEMRMTMKSDNKKLSGTVKDLNLYG